MSNTHLRSLFAEVQPHRNERKWNISLNWRAIPIIDRWICYILLLLLSKVRAKVDGDNGTIDLGTRSVKTEGKNQLLRVRSELFVLVHGLRCSCNRYKDAPFFFLWRHWWIVDFSLILWTYVYSLAFNSFTLIFFRFLLYTNWTSGTTQKIIFDNFFS